MNGHEYSFKQFIKHIVNVVEFNGCNMEQARSRIIHNYLSIIGINATQDGKISH